MINGFYEGGSDDVSQKIEAISKIFAGEEAPFLNLSLHCVCEDNIQDFNASLRNTLVDYANTSLVITNYKSEEDYKKGKLAFLTDDAESYIMANSIYMSSAIVDMRYSEPNYFSFDTANLDGFTYMIPNCNTEDYTVTPEIMTQEEASSLNHNGFINARTTGRKYIVENAKDSPIYIFVKKDSQLAHDLKKTKSSEEQGIIGCHYTYIRNGETQSSNNPGFKNLYSRNKEYDVYYMYNCDDTDFYFFFIFDEQNCW